MEVAGCRPEENTDGSEYPISVLEQILGEKQGIDFTYLADATEKTALLSILS